MDINEGLRGSSQKTVYIRPVIKPLSSENKVRACKDEIVQRQNSSILYKYQDGSNYESSSINSLVNTIKRTAYEYNMKEYHILTLSAFVDGNKIKVNTDELNKAGFNFYITKGNKFIVGFDLFDAGTDIDDPNFNINISFKGSTMGYYLYPRTVFLDNYEDTPFTEFTVSGHSLLSAANIVIASPGITRL
ncbi:MAG: hypothetical protein PHF63_00100 [Herbinix sp.]|nr:hypothetical protein [Herbinix sp.]